ncbi:MAG: hypothetical protein NXH83_00530 [Rhodobacteraceae bacterium]|nr:hypothetical protein [Paracoccaceae bacterium]
MADFIQDLADKLARDTLEASKELDDPFFYDQVSKMIGASSTTLQEAFLTSIRIRQAEARGRRFMEQALAAKKAGAALPLAPPDPDTGGH